MDNTQLDELLAELPSRDQVKRLIEVGEAIIGMLDGLDGDKTPAWCKEVIAGHKVAPPFEPIPPTPDQLARTVEDEEKRGLL